MNIKILNTSIKQDKNELFCINDIHVASGRDKSKQPSNWMRLETTKELIDELARSSDLRIGEKITDTAIPVSVIKGGKNQGTYVCKELVYAYSMWINAKFHLHVIRTFEEAIQKRHQESNRPIFTDEQMLKITMYEQPQEWEKRFQSPFYQALSKMTNLPFQGHSGGCPALFGMITQKWVYGVVLPTVVYKAIKEKLTKGDKIHQYLKPAAMKAVEAQLISVTTIAKGCIDYKDFEARCSTIFNTQGQIKLILSA